MPKRKIQLKWFGWVVGIAFFIFVINRLSEQGQIVEALRKGDIRWILLALILQLGFFFSFAKLYQQVFRILDMAFSVMTMFLTNMASLFTTSITPTAGISGLAVFAQVGRKKGFSAVRGTMAFILESVIQVFGYCLVAGMGILYLIFFEQYIPNVLIFVLLLNGAACIGLIFLLVMGSWKPKFYESLFAFISRVGNWLWHKLKRGDFVSAMWPKARADEMGEALTGIWSKKKEFVQPILVSVLLSVLQLLSMWSLLMAFGEAEHIKALFSGYILTSVATSVFVGPLGIGLYEAGMAIVLSHFGVASGAAALVAIMFRALNFWLPFFIGYVSLRRLKVFE